MKHRHLCLILILILLLSLCPAAHADKTEPQVSESLVGFLKEIEGFRADPYSSGSAWYIGYGCSCDPALYPNGITETEADALLRSKLESFAAAVRSFLTKNNVEVTQQQFDALCSMSYSLGTSWLSAANRLPAYLIDGIETHTEQEIASAFAAWCHAGGTISVPTLQRRIMEANMFLYGSYVCSAVGWCWLITDAAGGENEFSDISVYRSGAPYGTLPTANRSGYYFEGWQKQDRTMLRAEETVVQNLSVTALWSSTPTEQTKTTVPETPTETKPVTPVESVFSDVASTSWYAYDVNSLASQGVVNGYPDGTFRPNSSVTWGESLKLILRASGYSEKKATTSEDGSSVHWAQGYLDFAEQKGFLSEGSVTNLEKAATRNEIADLCAAALGLSAPSGMSSPFADTGRGSVLALYQKGILQGSFDANGKRLYKGGDKISRAEVCAIMVRVADYVASSTIVYNDRLIPIDTTLKLCSYDRSGFYTQNGRLCYHDGTTVTRAGIDVSYYQGKIDWRAVAADGIDFAIIRCGYRGYTSGALNDDEKFVENISGALSAGLDVGVYVFSQATTVAEALEEASFTLSKLRGWNITYPVIFDWEQVTTPGSRTKTFDGKTVTDCAVAFCDAIAAAGYTPMVYFNKALAYTKLDMHRMQNYDGWLAWYSTEPNFVYDYQMWQYSSSGKVSGISTRVDMNLAFVDFAKR